MKRAEALVRHRSILQILRKNSNRSMLASMVADNIADLIPDGWVSMFNGYGLRFTAAEGAAITVADFDKLMGKLAKAFNREPEKRVYPETITASYWVYLTLDPAKKWDNGIHIEFAIGNTEKCDFVVKWRMQKVNEPTGYCKMLEEKKYLADAKV